MHLILLPLLLPLTMAYQDSVYPKNCKNKDRCDISKFMEQIECPATHTNTSLDCTCKTDNQGSPCEGFPTITNKDMDKEECKKQCESLEGCAFYRWDQVGYTHEITCTLMSVGQCEQEGSVCVPNSKGCESDAVGGKCKSDSDIRPVGQNCGIKLSDEQLQAEKFGIKIQWVCFDPFNKDGEELDVYDPEGLEVLNGVKCETLDRCTDFGPDDTSGSYVTFTCNDATWDTDQTLDDDPLDQDGKLVKELECSIDPLTVPKENLEQGTGAELICSTPTVLEEDVYTVNPPNSCAFLCDKHHVVTIQSGWTSQEEGKAGWNLYVTGNPKPTEITDGDDQSCWSRRIFGYNRRG